MDQAAVIRELRERSGLSRADFCRQFRIPYRTMSEWERGGRHAPEYLVRLLEYAVRLDTQGKETGEMDKETTGTKGREYDFEGKGKTKSVRETAFAYGADAVKQEYTIDDYFALPDDRRAELIDGVFYDMATPEFIHQGIVGEFYHQLRTQAETKGCPCIIMISPVSVQLDRDNRTMVEPDVLILCDRSKMQKRVIYGAPDFVAEVLSPSTRKKDMNLKLFKYSNAGVREYWMVDPKNRKVIVHNLEGDDIPMIYRMDEKIPIGISEGKCGIDFAAMMDAVGFMAE